MLCSFGISTEAFTFIGTCKHALMLTEYTRVIDLLSLILQIVYLELEIVLVFTNPFKISPSHIQVLPSVLLSWK